MEKKQKKIGEASKMRRRKAVKNGAVGVGDGSLRPEPNDFSDEKEQPIKNKNGGNPQKKITYQRFKKNKNRYRQGELWQVDWHNDPFKIPLN